MSSSRPRRCKASGKKVYETQEAAESSGLVVMLARRRDVYVYPCELGGFHISTVKNKRCR